MKKFIGITLLCGLTVSVFVVDRSENKANLLTVESECLFLDKDINLTDNLLKLKTVISRLIILLKVMDL